LKIFGEEIDNYTDKSAFTSGILLFNNCNTIKLLFHSIKLDIINYNTIFYSLLYYIMASTRNKNTPINYNLEQGAYRSYRQQLLYPNAANGQAYTTQFAGNGLLQGPMPWNTLSHNAADVESFLFGIGSTNLVSPKQDPTPEINKLNSLNIIDKTPLIMPETHTIPANQRRMFLN
jgi:hypothetical protein